METIEAFGPLFWIVDMNGTIDECAIVNIDSSGPDEVAINIREQGIVVYEGTSFTEKWRYTAPTATPKKIYFDDIDGDGVIDMTLLCHDRIAFYDRTHEALFGVYYAPGSLGYLRTGNFDDTGTLDFMFYYHFDW